MVPLPKGENSLLAICQKPKIFKKKPASPDAG
jgi:hypothetical protein